MRSALPLALVAALLPAGCVGDGVTLALDGEGAGERARTFACDGNGGRADAVLDLTARTSAGVVTLLVRDGLDALVHERHVALGSGGVEGEVGLSGAPGIWTLEERRSAEFRGEFTARLTCGAP